MENNTNNGVGAKKAKTYQEAFGNSFPLWEGFRLFLEDEYGSLVEEWKYYNIKSGWILKVVRDNRTIFYLTPMENQFRLAFSFGDKAVNAVEESNLPAILIERLKNARKYVDGRALQWTVKKLEDLRVAKKLVDIKINN